MPAPLFADIREHLAHIEEEIHGALQTEIPLLNTLARHLLDSGGKRVRPALAVYACQLFRTADQGLYAAAAALEHLHTATLLHDDVVDEAETRRGQAAARMLWGNQASVLVGDYLLAHVFRSLTELKHQSVLECVSEAARQMAKGEILQLLQRYETASEADYLQIITYKTACLFAAAGEVGAAWGGASPQACRQLYNYGHQLGLAFQITDDALDYLGSPAALGKPVGSDLREGKLTLPMHRLLESASAEEQEWLLGLLKTPAGIADADLERIVALMRERGSASTALAQARQHAAQAIAQLEGLPQSPALQELIRLAEHVTTRQH